MKKKILLSYLTYVNKENRGRRIHIFEETFKEFSKLKGSKGLSLLSIDNNSDNDIVERLRDSEVFDYSIHLNQNMYDIANLYFTSKVATDLNYKYMMYCYDDFVFYDYDFAEDCIEFMEKNPTIQSIRMPWIEFDNLDYFNSQLTSKVINPDAVRHYNQPHFKKTSKRELGIWPLEKVGKHKFSKGQWHYTSRPTLWRTSFFHSIFDHLGDSFPVMQNFEGHAMQYFYEKEESHLSSFIDGGVAKTFKQSERASAGGSNNFNKVYVEKSSLDEAYNSCFKKLITI